jgi:hypothetical protein
MFKPNQPIMKKILAALFLIATFVSCSKEDSPAAKTYTVEYRLELAPVAGTTLSGTATYVSKTSATSTASLSSPGWTITENNWTLKSGDRVGFKTTISNLRSYKAFLIVDGAVKGAQSEELTSGLNGNIELYYTLP